MTDTASHRLDEHPSGAPRRRAAGLTLLGPGLRRRDRLRRPGQRRRQPHRGRASTGTCCSGCSCSRTPSPCWSSTCPPSSAWSRAVAARAPRARASVAARAGCVLGAGRARRRRDRRRRGHRRRARAPAALRRAARRRRAHHRARLAGCCCSCSTAAARAFETVVIAAARVPHASASAPGCSSPGSPGRRLLAGLVPRFEGATAVLLAASMLGATVMPHAVYLHSALARDRHGVVAAGPDACRRAASRPGGTSASR